MVSSAATGKVGKMRRNHPAVWIALLVGAGVLASSVPGSTQEAAAGAAPRLELYTGAETEVAGVKLGGWGSGMAKEDTAKKTLGEASIRIDTNGYYAGGRIEFEAPKDITQQKNDPYGYLLFIVQFQ